MLLPFVNYPVMWYFVFNCLCFFSAKVGLFAASRGWRQGNGMQILHESVFESEGRKVEVSKWLLSTGSVFWVGTDTVKSYFGIDKWVCFWGTMVKAKCSLKKFTVVN